MQIQLSDHFTTGRLLRFAVPSVIMMIFTSIYCVIDGFFLSNNVGETAFAAVNFIMPFLMIFDSFGFMLSAGGAAFVSYLCGQNDSERANKVFSLIVYIAIGLGCLFGILLEIFVRPVAVALGAEGAMLEYAVLYSRVIVITSPAYMLQYTFQSFFVAAERPKLGLAFTLAAGVTNIILDWLFMAVFSWGVVGAAVASCIGQIIGGFGPFIYFLSKKNTSILHLCKASFDIPALKKTCSNGFADFLTNASMSLVSVAFNMQLIKYSGELGVAAFGIISIASYVFLAAFLGYSMGVSPIISYDYGAESFDELHNVSKKNIRIIVISSVVLVVLAEVLAHPVANIFAGYDPEFMDLSIRALRLYVPCYLFGGFNIYVCAFFAALNCGKISSILSVIRMLVFQLLSVMIVPVFLQTDGIWLSMLIAEFGTLFFTAWSLVRHKKKFHY